MADFRWTARLTAGPFDGATLGLNVDERELPHAVVVTFAVGESAARLVWHSYALDLSRSAFRYLGEDPVLGEDGSSADGDPGRADEGDATSAGDGVTRRFYELLFERDPSLRSMFSPDIRPQAAMLRTAVDAVLTHLDDPGWLNTTLGALGARHAERGVTASMYADFSECMLTAMAEFAGDRWTPELYGDWRATLEDITERMLAGAAPTG